MNTQKTICFVAGKSGGHLLPCLTQAQHYAKADPSTKIVFFTTSAALDKKIMQDYPFIHAVHYLEPLNVPYRKPWRFPYFIVQCARALQSAFTHLRRYKPTTLITTGGFISVPVCIAAKLCNVPIELYELNVLPGKASKLIAKLATHIGVCFAQTQRYFPAHKTALANYPLRFSSTDKYAKEDACAQLQLDPARSIILILGGSQGSLFINRTIMQWLELQPELHSQITIIHQIGSFDTTNWPEYYAARAIPAIVFEYNANMAPFYNAADVIICRSGAGTLFEVQFFGKECITIPLITKTTDHQMDNARAMAHNNSAIHVCTEQEIMQSPASFNTTLRNALTLANR